MRYVALMPRSQRTYPSKPHVWSSVVVSAVANPDGAWVPASVARVRRSMKRGDEVNHPRRDPGHDVLEKV
jgi:hypothetical protein